jgi:AraC-like DNA-binding protein
MSEKTEDRPQSKSNKRKVGRPRAIDDEKFTLIGKLCQFKLKLSDVAELAGCSETTIEDEIKSRTGVNFRVFRDQKMAHVRQSLAQKAIQQALGGNNVMLIFCLKNMNGWSDTPDFSESEEMGLEFVG